MMTGLRALCGLVLASALAGAFPFAQAAHAQRDRATVLLSDKPAPRDGCRIVPQPGRLPSFAQLADSVSLASALAKFAADHPVRDGKVFALYSVAFAGDGSVERVAPLDYWLPQGEEPALNAMIRASLARQQPGGPWSVRIRVEPGAEPVFRVGRSEMCSPRLTSRFELTAPALALQQAPPAIRVNLVVSNEGIIRSLTLVRSTGEAELDRWVHDTILGRSLQPGLLDGVAVEMKHQEDVRIKARP